ncbi:MAG: hypothetical protein ABI584_07695 [Acidobacteriota bacterium]
MRGETPSGAVGASGAPSPPAARKINNWVVLLGLGVTTAGVLASQLVLARFLGATVGYYFAFVLVSFAMLGLASGALAVYFALPRIGLTRAPEVASVAVLGGAISLHFGLLSALRHYVRVSTRPEELTASITALLWVLISLVPFFLLTGLAVSVLLAASADRFHVT